MTALAAALARRIELALKSGKLKADGHYTVPTLAAALGATRAEMVAAVHKEFGSIAQFCTQIGFAGLKP